MDSECVQLEVLRRLFDRTKSYRNPKRAIYLDHVRPNVITLETALREMGYEDKEERRELRLYILSAIARRPIATTYDIVYASELASITNYIREYSEGSEDYAVSEDGTILLEFLAREFEANAPAYTLTGARHPAEAGADLPDMPF
jgi:hypothetical protein